MTLTREGILALKAGPELDQLVAAEVMGSDFVLRYWSPSTVAADLWNVLCRLHDTKAAALWVGPNGVEGRHRHSGYGVLESLKASGPDEALVVACKVALLLKMGGHLG